MSTFNPNAKKYYRKDGAVKSLGRKKRSIVADLLFARKPSTSYWVGPGNSYYFVPEDCDKCLLEAVRGVAMAIGEISDLPSNFQYWQFFSGLRKGREKLFDIRDVLYRYFFDKYCRDLPYKEENPPERKESSRAGLTPQPKPVSYTYSIDNTGGSLVNILLNGKHVLNIEMVSALNRHNIVFLAASVMFEAENKEFFEVCDSGDAVDIQINPLSGGDKLVLRGVIESHGDVIEKDGCEVFSLHVGNPYDASILENRSFITRTPR